MSCGTYIPFSCSSHIHEIATTDLLSSFKDGKISIPADDDDVPDQVEDLKGWNLAVTIDLKEQSVYVDPDADPDTQADQQALWDFIHNKFDVPGDYSIARLYAKLAGKYLLARPCIIIYYCMKEMWTWH